MRLITASKISSIPFPVFALTINASSGTIPKVFSISVKHVIWTGVWQVYLADDRDDCQIMLHGKIGISDRLRLNALRGIHQQERSLRMRQDS